MRRSLAINNATENKFINSYLHYGGFWTLLYSLKPKISEVHNGNENRSFK